MKTRLLLLTVLIATISYGQIITTVAGGGSVLDSGLASNAVLYTPQSITTDLQGNVYIADTYNNRIRKVNKTTGIITTVAGTGIMGFSGDGELAINAQLGLPNVIAVDTFGNIFISDLSSYRLRKVDATTGIITTIAGTGIPGFSGENGLAINAQFRRISSMAVDRTGNIYFGEDLINYKLRKITKSTGIISTVAGDGTYGSSGDGGLAINAQVGVINAMAIDSANNIYISIQNFNSIRKINASTGIISTIVGTANIGNYTGDGGLAINATLSFPTALSIDLAGNLYIYDINGSRVRKVTASTGIITTVAGNGGLGLYNFNGINGQATAAHLNMVTSISVDNYGNLYCAEPDVHCVRKINLSTGIISFFAANNSSVGFGDGNQAGLAHLIAPNGLAIDLFGNYFVSDFYYNVRKITGSTGNIASIAGTGFKGNTGDGGQSNNAQVNNPYDVKTDVLGNVFIADINNNTVRKIDVSNGIISKAAGNQSQGFAGDNGLAINASLFYPGSIAFDTAGNCYIADMSNKRIRKVAIFTGIITTVAGGGTAGNTGDNIFATSAQLANPNAVAIDSKGNIYIAESSNKIRKVDKLTGIITTIAGTGTGGFSGDGGLAINAKIANSGDIIFDSLDNLYFCDRSNHCVRKIAAISGIITSIAGVGGFPNFSGDGDLATNAKLNYPDGLAFDKTGNLYIADSYNNRIRKVTNVAILPLQLLNFSATLQINLTNLSWQTTNEVNTSHFTIQRSVDGTSFNNIGKVAAKGGGNYEYKDDLTAIIHDQSPIYYRLQIIDKDGSFTYSKVVAVTLNDNRKTLVLYPNPVKDNLFVQFTSTKTEKLTLQVTDLQGKLLQQIDTQVGVGTISLSVNTSTLAKGSYVLLVKGSDGVQQKQFVKE